jgi:hypothetical protein
MHEELFSEAEELISSSADGVQLAKSLTVDLAQLQKSLGELSTQLQAGSDEKTAINRLTQLVPEFQRESAKLLAAG